MVSDLYATLTDALPEGRPPSDWPGSSQWFGNRLTRAIPPLRAIGIEVSKREDAAGTRVSIKKIAPLSPLAPQAEKIAPPQQSQKSAVTGANGANGAKNPTLAPGVQRVCHHCGRPPSHDDPLLECHYGDRRVRLHRRCEAPWREGGR